MRKKSSVFKNILYAFGAQVFSMLLSILMALFLPKILGVTDYSYWQLFIFYTSYAGFFHFGFNDGVYLQQGGKEYAELDFCLLNSDLLISTSTQILLGTIVSYAAAGIFQLEEERIYIIITTVMYIILCNYSGFLSYILQVSNRIKEYSLSVVIDKVSFILIVLGGIVIQCNDFKVYILLYLVSKIVSMIYVIQRCKELVCSKRINFPDAIKDTLSNIKVGINLSISSVASMLILGVGRTMIDSHWGVEAFGVFSLALSLSNFFLQFISQVSLVLFTTFRRYSNEKIAIYYENLRTLLSIVLSGMLLGYMPLYYLMRFWLPQYSESLRYMVILLPICTFDGKMNMLCNTYLKVLRKEKLLLKINLLTLLMSLILCSISTFILNNIYAVTISMVLSIVFRSIIAEIYLSAYFGKNISINIVLEVMLSFVFVLSTWFIGIISGFLLYSIAFFTYCLFRKKDIIELINTREKLL